MISALLIIREGLYEALRHNAQPLNDSLFSIITNLVCLGTSWGGYQRSTPAMDPVRGNKGPQYWNIHLRGPASSPGTPASGWSSSPA